MTLKSIFIYFTYIVSGLFILILIINFNMHAVTCPYIYENPETIPKVEVVLIPGAAVFTGGELTGIFEDRVNAAIEFYELGKASKFLVSGDNSTVSHNEVNPVRKYLLSKGIPDE